MKVSCHPVCGEGWNKRDQKSQIRKSGAWHLFELGRRYANNANNCSVHGIKGEEEDLGSRSEYVNTSMKGSR